MPEGTRMEHWLMHGSSFSDPVITHPETAWIALAVPLWMAMGTILLFTLLLRGKLRAAVQGYLTQRAARDRASGVDPQLLFTPPITSAGHLLAACLIAVLILLIIL